MQKERPSCLGIGRSFSEYSQKNNVRFSYIIHVTIKVVYTNNNVRFKSLTVFFEKEFTRVILYVF